MDPVIIYIFYVIKQYIIYSKNNIYYYKINNVIKYHLKCCFSQNIINV